MAYANIQGILKNSDLLLDLQEIHSLLAMVLTEQRPIEIRIGRSESLYTARLLNSKANKWLSLTDLHPETGHHIMQPDIHVTIRLPMDGFTLETNLTCLNVTKKHAIRLTYPTLFRVHSKRQINRFSTTKEMTSWVEMTSNNGQADGELQDLNPTGLSFLGTPVNGEIQINEPVRLRLMPLFFEHSAINLTGILRFVGQNCPKESPSPKFRYSVQIVSIVDEAIFNDFYNKIKINSREAMHTSIITSESYRITATI